MHSSKPLHFAFIIYITIYDIYISICLFLYIYIYIYYIYIKIYIHIYIYVCICICICVPSGDQFSRCRFLLRFIFVFAYVENLLICFCCGCQICKGEILQNTELPALFSVQIRNQLFYLIKQKTGGNDKFTP